MITVAAPPTRPQYNRFAIAAVHLSAGSFSFDVRVTNTLGVVVGSYGVQINPGSADGLAYTANGDIQPAVVTDATITVAAAFAAFAGAAGNFAAKALALETYAIGKGILPSGTVA